jgi:carboxymethylenebutenolidase
VVVKNFRLSITFAFVAALTFLPFITAAEPAIAQDWAKGKLEKSPRHLEWVKVKRDKHEINSFIAYPEVKNKATAVLVIHEIFGLSDWIRSIADDLAKDGFIAIAPDLLSGKGPAGGGTNDFKSQDDIRKAMADLDKVESIKDLQSVADYVSKLPACNGKVAVVGFCWGGGKAWRFAPEQKNLKAAHAFYGVGPDTEEEVKNIPCPVYGYYGENDNRVNSTIDRTVEWMKKNGKNFEPVTYKGAGHGFLRAGEAPDAKPADKEARAKAWERLTEQLRGL